MPLLPDQIRAAVAITHKGGDADAVIAGLRSRWPRLTTADLAEAVALGRAAVREGRRFLAARPGELYFPAGAPVDRTLPSGAIFVRVTLQVTAPGLRDPQFFELTVEEDFQRARAALDDTVAQILAELQEGRYVPSRGRAPAASFEGATAEVVAAVVLQSPAP